MTPLLREHLVYLSVYRALRDGLPAFGVVLGNPDDPNANLHLREAFPTPEERNGELALSTMALSMEVDDGGRAIELGSTLTEYTHQITAWTFATEPDFGQHAAQAVKHVVRTNDDRIPLFDFSQPEPLPQIDVLLIDRAMTQHQLNNSPRPWDQYVWTTHLSITDQFYE